MRKSPIWPWLVFAGGSVGIVLLARTARRSPSTPWPLPREPKPLEPIESYAKRELQIGCDPTPKPGVVAFRNYVLRHFGGRDAGIGRECSLGGMSEHKEGRAWDWAIKAGSAEAQRMLAWLLAPDRWGNDHAVLRKAGVMLVIFDRQIWRAYEPRSWQPYTGRDPHTTHMHLSFSWDGAMRRTSFYRAIDVA